MSRCERHGACKTRLYNIWSGMKRRCNDPKNKYYGGRGIRVCDEWDYSFGAFQDWALANGYHPKASLDRYPDNDGNYEPRNCRWANQREQMRNSRRWKKA